MLDDVEEMLARELVRQQDVKLFFDNSSPMTLLASLAATAVAMRSQRANAIHGRGL